MAEDMSELSRDVLVARLWKAQNQIKAMMDSSESSSAKIEELEMRIKELERGNVQTDERYPKKD